jgi:precorrin-3B methylase
VVVSRTTDGALSVTNWQEIETEVLPGMTAAFAFAVITYDPDGNDTDNMVTSEDHPIEIAEQDGNKHEAEYA